MRELPVNPTSAEGWTKEHHGLQKRREGRLATERSRKLLSGEDDGREGWRGTGAGGGVLGGDHRLSLSRLLEPDRAPEASSQMERISLVRRVSSEHAVSPFLPSPKSGENHTVTSEGSQPGNLL